MRGMLAIRVSFEDPHEGRAYRMPFAPCTEQNTKACYPLDFCFRTVRGYRRIRLWIVADAKLGRVSPGTNHVDGSTWSSDWKRIEAWNDVSTCNRRQICYSSSHIAGTSSTSRKFGIGFCCVATWTTETESVERTLLVWHEDNGGRRPYERLHQSTRSSWNHGRQMDVVNQTGAARAEILNCHSPRYQPTWSVITIRHVICSRCFTWKPWSFKIFAIRRKTVAFSVIPQGSWTFSNPIKFRNISKLLAHRGCSGGWSRKHVICTRSRRRWRGWAASHLMSSIIFHYVASIADSFCNWVQTELNRSSNPKILELRMTLTWSVYVGFGWSIRKNPLWCWSLARPGLNTWVWRHSYFGSMCGAKETRHRQSQEVLHNSFPLIVVHASYIWLCHVCLDLLYLDMLHFVGILLYLRGCLSCYILFCLMLRGCHACSPFLALSGSSPIL